ncbi:MULTISPECIES: esterase-like activity of phytase family protein [unclassified Chelatococcus]|uniref:esterase-like activity of phytase family protein n=1 Tax=unclassified Chelatococcus TaxID=2638111 RepID=UPI001BCD9D52|nr:MULTISPECIES: esterase-like activity of phytase family protein [unclassified Chelatococcus]CAH1670126.1 Phytase-like domain-containing protein [Hyphomicrobiales bacterium]MBS7738297.1 esterase-like activity of phytase family protein [Chelatococcus sp. HY11]MBX3545825.1 esterase-like activity of phytase family protein [Chelatococcus sp.]MCO5077357.1 esterase-like activity of phytase family protein [Chelatococcus sp.]CAH1677641.1 Phytase-like domain-containing protein [Hyphomicrobiales bacter
MLRTRLSLLAAAFVGLTQIGLAPAALAAENLPRAVTLRFIGERSLPAHTDVDGTRVGGLSGLAFDGASKTWIALSDDRSEKAPARFYTLRLDYDASGFRGVTVDRAVTLLETDGKPFPIRSIDPEALRLHPAGGALYWTSEGDATTGVDPVLRAATADGRFLREIKLPERYRVSIDAKVDAKRGPRNNLAFEGLALTPDAATLIVALENALVQDGPKASLTETSPVRVATFDVASGQAGPEWVYVTDPIRMAPAKAGGFADNGVSDILALDAETLLVMERGYSAGKGNDIRLYRTHRRNATDVSAIDALSGATWTPLDKALVLDLTTLGVALDNFEGMDFGPRLENGNRTLVIVSDDNFNDAQTTKFLAFEVIEKSGD